MKPSILITVIPCPPQKKRINQIRYCIGKDLNDIGEYYQCARSKPRLGFGNRNRPLGKQHSEE